ncbi:MAG: hypothetical protein M3N43_07510 [Actinomycetota bacterium]|nr:hypothetical protein [Actinomycetota bacterium]
MPEWVHIVHASVPESYDAPPLVTREAYDEVWKGNGWRLAPKIELADDGAPLPLERPKKPTATKKRS